MPSTTAPAQQHSGTGGGGGAGGAGGEADGVNATIDGSIVPKCIDIVVSMDDTCEDVVHGRTQIYFRKLEVSSPLTWCPPGDSDDDVWLFYIFVLALIRQTLRTDVDTGACDILGSFDRAGIDAGPNGKTRTHLDHFDWIRELLRPPTAGADVSPPLTLKRVLDEPLVQVFLLGLRGDVVQALQDRGVSLTNSSQLNVEVTDQDQIEEIWARCPRPKPDRTTVVRATVKLNERDGKQATQRQITGTVDVSAMVQVTDTWESVVDCIKAKVFDESDNPKVVLLPSKIRCCMITRAATETSTGP